jgi:glycosyltransferase involved in cell wall biosynthesis
MRIAIVTHNVRPGDGQGRVNVELTRYLLAQGHSVTLVAQHVAEDLLDAGAQWVMIQPLLPQSALSTVWSFRQKANRFLTSSRHRYDIVMGCGVTLDVPHTHNAVHFVHGEWLNSPFHNARVQTGPHAWYQWTFSSFNARWEKRTFDNTQTVIAVSEMVRRELVAIGVPDEKVEVVINGVDLGEFSPTKVDRSPLGLPEGPVVGLFAGDIKSPIKNLDTLLQGLVSVSGLHLAVAGRLDGSPYPALAQSLGVSDRVHFLGFRRDVADLMRAADFFVLPSRRDSCPLVLLEALASGLPVIASSQVGNATLLGDGAGFVLDQPEDAEGLALLLRRMSSQDALRKTMSAAARATAQQHSWTRMAARYEALFAAFMTESKLSSLPSS